MCVCVCDLLVVVWSVTFVGLGFTYTLNPKPKPLSPEGLITPKLRVLGLGFRVRRHRRP